MVRLKRQLIYVINIFTLTIRRRKNRSSRWYMFLKINVLKNFVIFTGKHLLLIKLQAFKSFKNSSFYRTPLMAVSEKTRWDSSTHCTTFIIWKNKWFLTFKSRFKIPMSAKQTSSYSLNQDWERPQHIKMH